MRKLLWGGSFRRALRRFVKKNPGFDAAIEETLGVLAEDPFDPRLGTHKLKGKLARSWACSAGYDLRIIFGFRKNKKTAEDEILLFDIGSHDEVY